MNIDERLARLERTCRRQRLALLVVSAVMVSGLCMGAASPRRGDFDVIEARQVLIRNPQSDTIVGSLGTDDRGGCYLRLWGGGDRPKSCSVALGANNPEAGMTLRSMPTAKSEIAVSSVVFQDSDGENAGGVTVESQSDKVESLAMALPLLRIYHKVGGVKTWQSPAP